MGNSSKGQSKGSGGYLGRILDERYRLDEVIGAGAIGKVYAGTQLAVDRKVAIKLLHPSVRDRELGKERFLREAKAVARLSHSSCLTLFDFGSDEDLGCFYMVTEFVEGRTLAERMMRGLLPVDQVFQLLYQITTALQHAHERGILHRDLKPENIMLVGREDARVSNAKVLDFGLARIREEAAQPETPDSDAPADASHSGEFNGSRLTAFGELNGTPAYMSPEQCRGDLNLTPACDYYALGVLAFELFEGELPFQAKVVQDLLSKHLNDPIPTMREGRAPQEVEDMVYRLLAKKPEHRLQSPAEILDTLRPYVSLDPSRDMSTSTLDRLRRDNPPPADSSAAMAATMADAETLADYDLADTPIKVDASERETLALDDGDELSRASAFGTLAATVDRGRDDTAEKARPAEQPRSSRALFLAGFAAVVALATVGVLWATGVFAPSQPTAPPSSPEVADRPEAAPKEAGEEPDETLTNTAASVAATGQESEAGEAPDGAPDDEAPDDEARGEANERKTAPAPAAAKPSAGEAADTNREEHRRPRKLELTY